MEQIRRAVVDLARVVLRGDRLGTATPGPQLSERVRRMLGGEMLSPASRTRVASVAVACAVAVGAFSFGSLVHAQQSGDGTRFEVASVRLDTSKPGSGGRGGGKSKDGGGGGSANVPSGPMFQGLPADPLGRRLSYSHTLYGFILQAYEIKGCRAISESCAGLEGGPEWLKKDRFAINAKVPDTEPDYSAIQFLQGETPRWNLMMRALLADRFGLKVHTETRTIPVFALTVAKGGSKLQPAKEEQFVTMPDGGRISNKSLAFTLVPGNDRVTRMVVAGRSLQNIAETLSGIFDRPVVDQTGYQGNVDFVIEFDRNPDETSPLKNIADPSMFTAFQEKLGIKVEAAKAPVQVLVIDRAERPEGN